MSWQLENKL